MVPTSFITETNTFSWDACADFCLESVGGKTRTEYHPCDGLFIKYYFSGYKQASEGKKVTSHRNHTVLAGNAFIMRSGVTNLHI